MRCGERPHQGTLCFQVNKGTFISKSQPGKNHGVGWGGEALKADSCLKVNWVVQNYIRGCAYL